MFDIAPAAAELNAIPHYRCRNCPRAEGCIGAELDGLVGARRANDENPAIGRYSRGSHLFEMGAQAQEVYVVRSGAAKSYHLSSDGDEQILGFHLPGDVIGLDAVASGAFASSAVALAGTEVCRLPLAAIQTRAAESAGFRRNLFDRLGREIQRLHRLLHLERCSAEQRLAAFLLGHARKLPKAGGNSSALTVSLPMSRAEIGKFLDLATETVSRMFSRLQSAGVIAVRGAEIELLDIAALQSAAAAVHAATPAKAQARSKNLH
jgi:CRP/FNR family transcriptional regulator